MEHDYLKLIPNTDQRFQKELDRLSSQCRWSELVDFLEDYANFYPDEYFVFAKLSHAYYHLDKGPECLANALEAMAVFNRVDPRGSDVIVPYHLGMAYVLNDMFHEAIAMFNQILAKNLKDIAYGVHGEGLKWARSFYYDSMYMKGLCYMQLGEYRTARRLIKRHLSKRCRGIRSSFPRKDVLNVLDKLNELLK